MWRLLPRNSARKVWPEAPSAAMSTSGTTRTACPFASTLAVPFTMAFPSTENLTCVPTGTAGEDGAVAVLATFAVSVTGTACPNLMLVGETVRLVSVGTATGARTFTTKGPDDDE